MFAVAVVGAAAVVLAAVVAVVLAVARGHFDAMVGRVFQVVVAVGLAYLIVVQHLPYVRAEGKSTLMDWTARLVVRRRTRA